MDEGLAKVFDVIANPIHDDFRYHNYDAFAQVLGPYGGRRQWLLGL
jgi:hypothetical protein